jgi:RNA polymerase sigma factor for flagellar operon FliA
MPKKSKEPSEAKQWAAYLADRGNLALRNRLVERYLHQADAAAKRLVVLLPRCCDADSIRQECRMALVGLVQKFEPGKKKKFAAYAAKRLSGAARDCLRNADTAPRTSRPNLAAYLEGVALLAQRLGRRPSTQEIEDEGLEMPVEIPCVVSLSSPTAGSDEDGDSLADVVCECRRRAKHRRTLPPCETFAQLLHGLDQDARTAVYLYYAKSRPLWQIAAMLDVSDSRVCQILADARRALEKLGKERLL